jgi:phosphate transport system substrate-binding protein
MRLKKPSRKAASSVVLAGIMVGLFSWQAAGSTGSGSDLVAWSERTLPTNVPQTDAEKEYGKDHGRRLPNPELLRPSLDPALPDFHPGSACCATTASAASCAATRPRTRT